MQHYSLIDTHTFCVNMLGAVTDSGSAAYGSDFCYANGSYSYSYDAAGQMTSDASKGITSISWNVLGLPQTVTFTDGAMVSYSYAADGTKLRESRTVSGTTTTTDYTGDLVLENGTRSRLLFDGGYVSVSNSAFHFFITDHLGSVRVVANTSGTAEEYDHYYPLGGPIAKYSTATSIQPLKFQGKEWGSSKGLDLYDFGARRYDPATGRWLSQDPLSEKYYAHSPYLFCGANPVKFVDPEGKEGIKYVDENGVKTVESNIVLLLRAKISYPDNASKKEINRIDRINSRIEQQNENKIREAHVLLNSTYNGETGGSYNSNGELVHFVFNIIGVELDSHPDQSVNIQRLALDNGLSAERFGKPVIAIAPVVYEGPTKGGFGMFSANSITLAPNAPNITLPHEVGHSLGLHDTYPSGGLMNYPPSYGLSSEEVDKIWERAFNRR